MGTRPKVQHFSHGLALAHTGCKVTISEKPDITFTKVDLSINARAQLIDRHHFRKPGEKLLYQVLVWFGFSGGLWWCSVVLFFFNLVAFLVKLQFKMSKHSAIVWSY